MKNKKKIIAPWSLVYRQTATESRGILKA